MRHPWARRAHVNESTVLTQDKQKIVHDREDEPEIEGEDGDDMQARRYFVNPANKRD